MTKKVSRLFTQFEPNNYNLNLDIDPDKMLFSGQVTIKGQRRGKPSKRITLHQKELQVTSAEITKHDKNGDQNISLIRINNQNKLDEVRLHSDSLITAGEYTVKLNFKGKITKPMNGIYPCFFKHDGQEKKLIATQFESHHAREAFPCIDEPEAKATFDLTIKSPIDQTVLSNTPIKNQFEKNKTLVTEFETSPKMSSYLLAFVVGDLEYQQATAKNGVIVRCFATPNQKKNLAFSVDVAVKSLEFFEDYFQIKYPLKKLDMVALPDFSSGAMENWGLITYRESAMLVDNKSTSVESKQHVALVIAHEMSHQWFGNLVTMRWWDDLWLNESFANMMEYRAVDEIFPEWQVFNIFVAHEGFSAKRRDSLKDVQSVHCEVNHPDEISTLFDPSIVYAKGGTLLYMLMNFIGEDNFKAGLTSYFNKHQYQNTVADDLWQALSESSGKDIGHLMQNWLSKPGYPIVDVDWQSDNQKINLSQKRFLSNKNEDPGDTIWQVPLASTLELNKDLLTQSKDEINLISKSKDALLINNEGKSYFIPVYTQEKHFQKIISDIKNHKISAINRLLVLDNYTLMQRAGNVSTTELLKLVKAFQGEDNETVWGAIGLALGDAWRLVELESKEDKKINSITLEIIGDLTERLGWQDRPKDDAHTLRLRNIIYSLAVKCQKAGLVEQGLKMFESMKIPADLPASTRSSVYVCASVHGTEADFKKLLKLYTSDISADEQEEVAGALCATRKPEHIRQLINLLKTDTIRRQNLMSWYGSLLAHRYSREMAWDWMLANWEWIEKEFSSDKSFGYFARIAGSVLNKDEELTKFKQFFGDKKDVIALKRDIQLATLEIESKVAWRKRNQDELKRWLNQ